MKWAEVIHQPDHVNQNQNNTRKAMEYFSHNDYYMPSKTGNLVDMVSS